MSRTNCWAELLKISVSLHKKFKTAAELDWKFPCYKAELSFQSLGTLSFLFFWNKHPKLLKTRQNSSPCQHTHAVIFIHTNSWNFVFHGIHPQSTEQSPESISNWTLLSVNISLKSCLEVKFSSLTHKKINDPFNCRLFFPHTVINWSNITWVTNSLGENQKFKPDKSLLWSIAVFF